MTDHAREAAEQLSARLFGPGDEPMARVIEPFIAAAIEAATQDVLEKVAVMIEIMGGMNSAQHAAMIRSGDGLECELCGRCMDYKPHIICGECHSEYSQPAKEPT